MNFWTKPIAGLVEQALCIVAGVLLANRMGR